MECMPDAVFGPDDDDLYELRVTPASRVYPWPGAPVLISRPERNTLCGAVVTTDGGIDTTV